MKKTGSILVLSIVCTSLSAQYYFTGEVKDPHGDNLQHVTILVSSTGATYKTGCYGNFEIMSPKTEDSLTFSVEGYEQYSASINAGSFLQVTLKELPLLFSTQKKGLVSVINGTTTPPSVPADVPALRTGLVENPFVEQSATVSFACNSNGISYSNIKRFLDMGTPVPGEAVKLEEMVNYFNFYYEEPQKDDLFHCSSSLLSCPWNTEHRLLFLNICAGKTDISKAAPANLVFLIDVSGSMDMPDKLPLIQSSLHLLIKNLRDIDTLSIVEYGGNNRVLEGIPGSAKGQILRAIEQLTPDGPSSGVMGLKRAYQVAQRQFIPGGNNKVILITDGDISETPAAARELLDLVGEQSREGILLSCLGVGMNKDEEAELPVLARTGQGKFACIEDPQSGERLLLNELAPNLSGIAEKVCVTAGFDTTLVKEYRLIGFENKRNVLDDTTFRLEGSSIGSAEALLALFELVPKKDSAGIENIAAVKINYCLPGQNRVRTMNYDCPNKPIGFDNAPAELKKAACMTMFGMKLKGSPCAANLSWTDIEKLTKKVFSSNNFMDRDYIISVVKARRIYMRSDITAK